MGLHQEISESSCPRCNHPVVAVYSDGCGDVCGCSDIRCSHCGYEHEDMYEVSFTSQSPYGVFEFMERSTLNIRDFKRNEIIGLMIGLTPLVELVRLDKPDDEITIEDVELLLKLLASPYLFTQGYKEINAVPLARTLRLYDSERKEILVFKMDRGQLIGHEWLANPKPDDESDIDVEIEIIPKKESLVNPETESTSLEYQEYEVNTGLHHHLYAAFKLVASKDLPSSNSLV